MSAPPPPTDREALARVAFEAWYCAEGYDDFPEIHGMWERVADALLAGPIADLRSKLAAVEAERDKAWGEAEAAERFATRHFVCAENAAAERDAMAKEAGEGFAEWARELALALGRRDVWVGLHAGSSTIIRQLEQERAAADSRAREAGARAERAEAALKPFCFGDPVMESILFDGMPDDAPCNFTVPLGAVRRARQALETHNG